ncbi:transporter substrate-binding domain-containing protein [Derxia lacustris]|uniref:transporter substrate-binding domain-containing protein n=1 Tax=Derxia lacustris TaxID=764842 RepID=UPI00111BDCDC|nr:transporter substrate-binding domain-containing protein [Derxia lacustris]
MSFCNSSRRALLRGAACATALGLGAVQAARADEAYDRIRATGILKAAVYKDFFPFSDDDKGIDVDIARALADKLGLKLKLLPFDAGEEMNDDLRNMVWKGHYLGYGPADVLLHVPVESRLQQANEQVEIFAPYWREELQIARNKQRIADWDGGYSAFEHEKIAVDGASLASIVMLGAEGGRYRNNVINERSVKDAIAVFRKGEAAAVMATRAELEAGLAGLPDIGFEKVVQPGVPVNGWVVGLAVKRESMDLAHALQGAMNGLIEAGAIKEIFARYKVRYTRP